MNTNTDGMKTIFLSEKWHSLKNDGNLHIQCSGYEMLLDTINAFHFLERERVLK